MKNKKILICSDIHGNLQALNAVLKFAKKLNPDCLICLGDVVGYGADPEACLKLLSSQNAIILKGNHEALLLGESDPSQCSSLGKTSYYWTLNHCGDSYKELIKKFPFEYHLGNLDFYHSSPVDDGTWPYLNDPAEILRFLSSTPGKLTFYSHTHRPRITIIEESALYRDQMILKNETVVIPLNDNKKYLINVGSVGQQRDSKTDASFAVLYISDLYYELQFKRIPYDSYRAYSAILHRGCGKAVSEYLVREKWRRKAYELLDHGRIRIRRKQPDTDVK